MEGLTMKGLKKHPALIPLYFCLAIGVAGAAFYTIRLAVSNPDVSWNKKKLEPWNDFSEKQYKFFNPSGLDVPKSQAPKF